MKPFCEKIDKLNEVTPDDNVKNDLSDIEIRLYEQQHMDNLYRQILIEGDNLKADNFETTELPGWLKRLINKEEKSDTEKFNICERGTIEMNDRTIVLNDEDGNEVELEFLDLIPYQSQEYAVLLPTDDTCENVVILKFEKTSNNFENYTEVDNEEIIAAVFDIFKEKYKNIFNFTD